jgi:cellulose synthase operon protein YhjQ
MADPLPEDVAALCNHAGIDSSLYKDFATQRSASAAAVSSSTAVDFARNARNMSDEERAALGTQTGPVAMSDVARQSKHAQSSTHEIQPPSVLVEGTEFAGVPTGAGGSNLVELPLPSHRAFGAAHSSSAVAENPRAVRDRWSAIQDVFSQGTTDNADAVAAHTLPDGSISVFAAGGGVGKTTIGATLARVLTSMGESILLAGLTLDSILPLYFGARSASGGTLRSFLMPRDHERGSLHLYLDYLSVAGLDGGTGGTELLDRLCSQAELVKDDVDRSVMVLPVGSLESLTPILRSASICLAILVPDLASAIGVGKLMRFFKEHEDQPISPYFLINKFDAARALHQEMRSRLQEQLGEHLLPVVIRRSDDVQDALAAGMTVIDYAPGTAVAQDFRHLAEWVVSHCGSGSAGQQK